MNPKTYLTHLCSARLGENYKMDANLASEQLHQIFNSLPRHSFPLNNSLPSNGIYILFEIGEKFIRLDRIVRIGTHTGNGRFVERLKDHFEKEKQRNSIFRKHIGRCLLNKNNNPYITCWDLPFKKVEDKARNKDKVDLNYEKKYELMITDYIRNNFSFVVIPNVNTEPDRLSFEASLISTIAQETVSFPSQNWLGKHHPDPIISNGKLWNIHHLNDQALSTEQIQKIKTFIRE